MLSIYILFSFLLTFLSTILAIKLSKYSLNLLSGTISLIASERYGWVYKVGASIGVILLLYPVSLLPLTNVMKVIAIVCFITTLGFIFIELRKYRTMHYIFTVSSFLLSLLFVNLLNPSIYNIGVGVTLVLLYLFQKRKYGGNALTVILLYLFILVSIRIVLNSI